MTQTYLYSIQTMNEDQLRNHMQHLQKSKDNIDKKLIMCKELLTFNEISNQMAIDFADYKNKSTTLKSI